MMPTMLPAPTGTPFNQYSGTRPYTFNTDLPADFFDEIEGFLRIHAAHPTNFGKWDGSTPARFKPLALVFHTPEEPQDDWESTPNWFANPAANASTHWYADDDGDLYQMLSEVDCSWGQGTRPTGMDRPNRIWKGEIDGLPPWSTGDNNRFALGIEVEGIAGSFVWAPNQYISTVRWATYKAIQYNIPFNRNYFVEHRELSTDRTDPGDGFGMDKFLVACRDLRDVWLASNVSPELTRFQAGIAAWNNNVTPLPMDPDWHRYELKIRRK